MLGTDWTAPLEGDNLRAILEALNEPIKPGDQTRATNLRLTGTTIQPYDRDRIRMVEVGQLGSANRDARSGKLLPVSPVAPGYKADGSKGLLASDAIARGEKFEGGSVITRPEANLD